MKAFITALCVLLVICAVVAFSVLHIMNACEELDNLARALPPLQEDAPDENDALFNAALEQLHQTWLRHRRILRFTVGHTETELIDDALDDLIVRYTYNDTAGYMSARRRLISCIEHIREAERFSADGIC